MALDFTCQGETKQTPSLEPSRNHPMTKSHMQAYGFQSVQKLGLLAHVKTRVSLQPWNLLGVILMVDLATPFSERNNILGGFLLVCNSSSCAHKWQNN
jgi:hypothetical protein